MSAFVPRSFVKLGCLLGLVGCLGSADEVEPAEESLEQVSASLQTRELDFPVMLRGVGSASIHATVFVNRWAPRGETVLAVHGLAETAATYQDFAAALFRTPSLRRKVHRVVAIDLVGHGESGFPEGLPDGTFGQLTIDDNVSVVLQSISQLAELGLAADTLVGHSMGGLAVQAAQEALLAQGSSLAEQGIEKAILLAPVPARDRPWLQPPASDPSPFFVTDPVLGTYLSFPPAVWIAQAFTGFTGTVAPNAPTEEVVTSRGYTGFEPVVTLAQLVGSPIETPAGPLTLQRPAVRKGAFAPNKGTTLALVSFSQDTLVPASTLGDLYTYLTGDAKLRRYVPVVADDAVHSMYISNPQGLISAARTIFGN